MAYSSAQIQEIVRSAARRYSIDEGIALRQIKQESGFNPNAVSSQGAQGLAQFIPGTWAIWGSGSPFDPVAAMEAWGKYFSHLLSKFGGDYRLALAGYHSGEGAAVAALRNCIGNPRTCAYVNAIMGGGIVSSLPTSPFTGQAPTTNYAPLVIVGVIALLFMR